MENCQPATAPGAAALKARSIPTSSRQATMHDLHKTRHLLRNKGTCTSIAAATSSDQQKLKHLLRYVKGAAHYKQTIRPTGKLTQTTYDLNVYIDSDWAGCVETRKSTTGFSVTFIGATISYGSRTQATKALSSAEAEIYAINTGATEAFHFQNLLTGLMNSNKANTKIHADASSGKSIATRIGKKTKHVELKHLSKSPAHHQNTHQ